MASFKKHCERCGAYYDAAHATSRFCSGTCRQANHREKQIRQLRLAKELLAEQTAAIEAGADLSVLMEIHRRTRRLMAE